MNVLSKKIVRQHNLDHAGDVVVTINVRCQIRQSQKSDQGTALVTNEMKLEDGVVNTTMHTLPEPVARVKKWIENTRDVIYSKANKYKHAGRICARVEPAQQDEFYKEVEKFIKTARERLLDACTDSDHKDRQAGYERIIKDAKLGMGKLADEVSYPSDYQKFVDSIRVFARVVPFSATPDYKLIDDTVKKLIEQTSCDDACVAYNGMLDTFETAVQRTLIRFRELHQQKSDGKKSFKWKQITNTALNTTLFNVVETILPMIPRDRSTNAVFNAAWAILGSNPKEMREHFIATKQIDASDEAWEKVLKKNPQLGKTNPGVLGRWEALFDAPGFKELPINTAYGQSLMDKGTFKGKTKMGVILKDEMITGKLKIVYKTLQSIPRIETEQG